MADAIVMALTNGMEATTLTAAAAAAARKSSSFLILQSIACSIARPLPAGEKWE
jgi:hypothetical protein